MLAFLTVEIWTCVFLEVTGNVLYLSSNEWDVRDRSVDGAKILQADAAGRAFLHTRKDSRRVETVILFAAHSLRLVLSVGRRHTRAEAVPDPIRGLCFLEQIHGISFSPWVLFICLNHFFFSAGNHPARNDSIVTAKRSQFVKNFRQRSIF